MGLYELAQRIDAETEKANQRLREKVQSMSSEITLTDILEAIKSRKGFPSISENTEKMDFYIDVDMEQQKREKKVEVRIYGRKEFEKMSGGEGFRGYKITLSVNALIISGMADLKFEGAEEIRELYNAKRKELDEFYKAMKSTSDVAVMRKIRKSTQIDPEILDTPITI